MRRCSAAGLLVIAAGCGGGAAHLPPDAGVSTPSSTVQAGVADVNSWRQLVGVGVVADQPQIQAAADAHLDFIEDNPSNCYPGLHQEDDSSGCAGFTGALPGDRFTYQGFQWSLSGEVIAEGSQDPADAVDQWIWTAYHRLILLDATFTDVGFALGSQYAVLDLAAPISGGGTPPSSVVVFPSPGLTSVRTSFDGSEESPTPPMPSSGWPSGPVVTMQFPSAQWTISNVTLQAGSGDPLPITLSTPMTDSTLMSLDLQDAAFFYADSPLMPGTMYTVTVTGTVGNDPWMQTWQFTTQGP